MHIESIKMVVTLSNGESFIVVEESPYPVGSNPRFLLRQFTTGVRSAMIKCFRLLEGLSAWQLIPSEAMLDMKDTRKALRYFNE